MSLDFILSAPLKNFMQAHNIIRLALESSFWFKNTIEKIIVFFNVRCYKNHFSFSESALPSFPKSRVLEAFVKTGSNRKGIAKVPLSGSLNLGNLQWFLEVLRHLEYKRNSYSHAVRVHHFQRNKTGKWSAHFLKRYQTNNFLFSGMNVWRMSGPSF